MTQFKSLIMSISLSKTMVLILKKWGLQNRQRMKFSDGSRVSDFSWNHPGQLERETVKLSNFRNPMNGSRHLLKCPGLRSYPLDFSCGVFYRKA